MAERDIDDLRIALPNLFRERDLDEDRVDGDFIPIGRPDRPYDLETSVRRPPEDDESAVVDRIFGNVDGYDEDRLADALDRISETGRHFPTGHPGGFLRPSQEAPVVPPDCLAFYLPSHQFHPVWWGVYLILDGVCWLAGWLWRESRTRVFRTVSPRDCWVASRL